MFSRWDIRPHARSNLPLGYAKNRTPSPSDLEQGLRRLCTFPRSNTERAWEQLPQSTFKYVSEILKLLDEHHQRHEADRWSNRPRIYAILCNINALAYMDNFVAEGVYDIALPYTSQTCPRFLDDDHDVRDMFLTSQKCVLTDARNLENCEAHVHFAEDAREHILHVKRLGHGGYGWVDEVISNLSFHRFARKRVLRSNNSSELARRAQQSLIDEIELMKKLRYKHLTQIVGSYTDPKYIAYLMDPVAEDNLYGFLSNKHKVSTDEAPRILRQFFGCLAGAVDYLHTRNVRHRDLKPQNILIKNDTVYLADFGAAYDWSKTDRQTTQDRDAPYTPNYMAPEVAAKGGSRNCASDMWSLGVVFLEIATVLKGFKLMEWNLFRERKAHAARIDPEPWRNQGAISDWLTVLQGSEKHSRNDTKDNEPLTWIKSLLHAKPEQRPDARSMVRIIKESPYFNDFCCDDCIERFEEIGFFFDEPEQQTQFSDRQTIDLQIASMDRQVESTTVVNHSRQSTIQNWLAQTQSELHFSVNDELPSFPIGAAADDRIQPIMQFEEESEATIEAKSRCADEKKPMLHASGRFYVEAESDCSDSDSFKTSETFQRTDDRDIRPARPYNIIEDSSSDEVRSLRSDDSIAAEGDRSGLATISEDDEEEQAEDITPATTIDVTEDAHYSEDACTQIAVDVDLGIGASTEREEKNATTGRGVCEKDEAQNATPALPTTQIEQPRKKAKLRRHKDVDKDFKSESSLKSAEPLNEVNAPQVLTPKRVRSPQSTRQTALQTITHVEEDHEHKLEITNDFTFSGSSPLVTTPEEDGVCCASLEVPTAQGQSMPAKQSPTQLSNSSGARVEIFDPLDYQEQTWRNVADHKSRATSVLSERSRNVLGGISDWYDRQNKLLEYFCQKGKAAAVRELLRKGSNPGTQFKPRAQPITIAAKGASLRHNKCAKALIEYGCDVNATWRGKTPLHWAVENLHFDGYLNLLAMLLQAGAEMSRPDAAKECPLTKLFAGPQDKPLEDYQIKAVALVLHPNFASSTGVDVNTQQPASLNTALHLAVQRRTPWAVKLLLHRGAKVNKKNAAGTTPLLMAASQWQFDLTNDQKTTLIYLLEKKKLRIDAVGTSNGRTALHQAAKAGCTTAISLLLERGADVGLTDKDGNSALSLCEEAARSGKTKRADQYRPALSVLEEAEQTRGR